jgi:hypothetical protein
MAFLVLPGFRRRTARRHLYTKYTLKDSKVKHGVTPLWIFTVTNFLRLKNALIKA